MTTDTIASSTSQYHRGLRDELSALRSQRSVEVPDDFMDYRPGRAARPSVRRNRIRELEELLAAGPVSGDRAAQAVAAPGMVLTIRYDATGETETFLLGRRNGGDGRVKVYSMASPLGRSIAGARPGEQRIYAIPNDTGRLVTLLKVVPYAGGGTKPLSPQNIQRCADAGRADERRQA